MDEITQLVMDKSVEILETGQDIIPMAFSLDTSGDIGLVVVPVLMPFNNQEEKRAAFGQALGAARALGSKRLLVLTDSWYVETADETYEEAIAIPPSQRMDRREALFLVDCTEVGVKGYMNKYDRDDDGQPQPYGWDESGDALDGMMIQLMNEISSLPDAPPELVRELRENLV